MCHCSDPKPWLITMKLAHILGELNLNNEHGLMVPSVHCLVKTNAHEYIVKSKINDNKYLPLYRGGLDPSLVNIPCHILF